jgi:protein-tyrosine-phosphatase
MKIMLFVCIENSSRSQMAVAFAIASSESSQTGS